MRQRFILDTGPLVALINRREQFHHWTKEQFSYELDGGNTGLASQMSNNAKELLNYFSVLVGGKLLSSELIAYGHLEGEYIYYPISRSPRYFGGSSGRGRVGFGNAQSAIVEGIIYQLTTTRFEGGDLYLKRALKNIQLHGNSRPVSVNTVDKLIDVFQVAQIKSIPSPVAKVTMY